jgi:phytoene dehydrogenase-like protein
VVVLGAGLAGPGTTHNPVQHGFELAVLEARGRRGGRVHTAREQFRRGGHAEFGATGTPASHAYRLKYGEALRLDLTPYGTATFYPQRKRLLVPAAEMASPPERFAPGEQPWPVGALPVPAVEERTQSKWQE